MTQTEVILQLGSKSLAIKARQKGDGVDKYYTTKKLLGHKKAELWRQFISETFVELDCNGMSRNDFFGELRARSVGGLGISQITTDAYDVFRTDNGISSSDNDAFIVSVQTSGSSTIRQMGREVTLKPGDFTIYDSTMPYHLHFESRLSQLVVKIPRERMKTYMQSPETMTAVHVKGGKGLAQITTSFASTLFDETAELDTHAQTQVADTFVSLLTSSLRETTTQIQRAPLNRETQLLRIKQYIAQNLREPEISLAHIAKEHQISERYLHQLFELETISPSRYIWNERLKATYTDLSNPLLAHHSISKICFSWGFNDSGHFSRAFKNKYNISPRAFRNTALH